MVACKHPAHVEMDIGRADPGRGGSGCGRIQCPAQTCRDPGRAGVGDAKEADGVPTADEDRCELEVCPVGEETSSKKRDDIEGAERLSARVKEAMGWMGVDGNESGRVSMGRYSSERECEGSV